MSANQQKLLEASFVIIPLVAFLLTFYILEKRRK